VAKKSGTSKEDAGDSSNALIAEARELARGFRVDDGRRFRLEQVDPDDTGSFGDAAKPLVRAALAAGVAELAKRQEQLWAHDRYSVLFLFQAMDAAGKDGAIEHVLSGVNPQGCHVASFKAPSATELDHDYLWRCHQQLPERGRIGIFNRSWYEEVLVVRVHPELLARQKLPEERMGKKIWRHRYEDINSFERYLDRNGTVVRKIFLHVSKAEQKRRFLARLDDPTKHWKFSAGDVAERRHWAKYMAAYEEMIRATASEHAPWYVVPADNKWFTRIVVAAVVIETLASLGLSHPKLDAARRRELEAARRQLLAE
jgi:PPK2 family polyphosphate:nucleotide phosphotransferase